MKKRIENSDILAEFQSYKWVMEPLHLQALIEKIGNIQANATLVALDIKKQSSMRIIDDTAVISIRGVLFKTVPDWIRYFGIEATGYDEIKDNMNKALEDEQIECIQLDIYSPGGMVDGVDETAEVIFKAREKKTVQARIEDLGASGAYWLASQADYITANKTAEVGSIGVYSVLYDTTKMEDTIGIKTIVVRSGEYKATGIDGVTDSQLEVQQEIIDGLADNFIQAVATGRNKNIDDIRELATGRVWLAPAARDKGLIDRVINSSEEISVTEKEITMSKTKEANVLELTVDTVKTEFEDVFKEIFDAGKADGAKAETDRFSALKAACGEDSELLVSCFAEGLTTAEAQTKLIDKLSEGREQDRKKIEELSATQEKLDPAVTEFNNQPDAAHQPEARIDESKATDEQLKEHFEKTQDLQDTFSSAEAYIAGVRHPAKK